MSAKMAEDKKQPSIEGRWRSSEAMGNSAAEWTGYLKRAEADAVLVFSATNANEGTFRFSLHRPAQRPREAGGGPSAKPNAKPKPESEGEKGVTQTKTPNADAGEASQVTSEDITGKVKHCPPRSGRYELRDNELVIDQLAKAGLRWTFEFEDQDTLMIKMVGLKKWGRCRGVDVIYFDRAPQENDLDDVDD